MLPPLAMADTTQKVMFLIQDALPLCFNPLAPNLCLQAVLACTQTPLKTHPILLTLLDVLVFNGPRVQ